MTEGAALAIRGHTSAHSFATGPVMAEPEQQSNAKEQQRLSGVSTVHIGISAYIEAQPN